jgi:hypothetical protein
MFASVAQASATTYCVAPATGCGGGDLPTISAALTDAFNNAGPDDVQLGAATYMDGPYSYADNTFGTNPVTIRGAGQFDSRLVSSVGGTPTLTLTYGNADNIVVFSPIAAGAQIAVALSSGTLSNSQVVVGASSRGIDATDATVDHVSVSPSSGGATGNTAVRADHSTITNAFTSTTNGVEVVNAPVAVRRSTIVTKGYGLQSDVPQAEITDSQIVLNDSTAVGVQGVCVDAIGPITITATNLTVTGGGSGTAFRSLGSHLCGGYVAVSSSLVQAVGKTVDCTAGGLAGASASVTVSYSDADLTPGHLAGTCTAVGPIDAGNNFLADPKLVSPAILTPLPRFDSPLIDAGDPAAPGAGQPTDIAGLPRAVNGRRDVGAFEYGRQAPVLTVSRDPAEPLPGDPVNFTATTSDPDQGDSVTVAWIFDDGASAVGDAATHAFSAPGTHTATATATDSAGVTTSQAVTVDVHAVDVPVGAPPNPPVDVHDTTAPQTEITKHPKARTKKPRAVFEFSSSEPGSSFECTIDKGAPSACTSPFPVKVKARRKPHSLSVVAIDAAGNRDATPASYGWTVKRKGR